MKRILAILFVLFLSGAFLFAGGQKSSESAEEDVTLTIATVNNPQMVVMEEYSDRFTEETGIELEFIVLPENELRQRVTQDVAMGAGQYDIVTIGTYDTPFWARNGWLVSLEDYFDSMSNEGREAYDREDLLSPIRSALSYQDDLYALPFYGESSMIYYRTDLFEEAGLTMPAQPTWDEVYDLAIQLHDPGNDRYGIVARGLPGWGQNMAVFGTIINAFGARWFDPDWNPTFDEPEMRDAWEFYKRLLDDAGQPNPTTDGYTEVLALMQSGRGAIYYDATVSAGTLESEDSSVAGNIGYAIAPTQVKENTGWLWAWSLGIEAASQHKEEAFRFLTWATSKEYIEMIGEGEGWAQVPPGTRISTYEDPRYQDAAPFADIVLESIRTADYDSPTEKPVPYQGVQYVSIPEFQSLGETVAQELAIYLTGNRSLDAALETSQQAALEVAQEGGYQDN